MKRPDYMRGFEPHQEEFARWLALAYREPEDGDLDKVRFTRWNMHVAYSAGKNSASIGYALRRLFNRWRAA